ncbi:TldD/PmbA family protein, partial [Eubacteriales bacterium OttesenSCG-928-M02]|nr:TldD/PmbA family protein [Eubacteriales bacterium OttesenSCG-928-M02]
MPEKQNILAALAAALSTGGDYAEVFFEDTTRNSLEYKDGRVETALSGRDYGAGVRVLKGVNYTYAYTSDVSEPGLIAAAKAAAAAMPGVWGKTPSALVLAPQRDMQPMVDAPSAAYQEKRAAICKQAHDVARAFSPEIVQAAGSVGDIVQNVIIANSEGMYVEDRRARSRFMVQAVASANGEMQTGYWGPGAGAGFEFYDTIDIEALAKSAANTAVTMLHAPFAPAGVMPAAIGNGFGGVIFHEACGHSL